MNEPLRPFALGGPSPRCACCAGRGVVTAYTGDLRPCSRCQADSCRAWFDARRLLAHHQAAAPQPAQPARRRLL